MSAAFLMPSYQGKDRAGDPKAYDSGTRAFEAGRRMEAPAKWKGPSVYDWLMGYHDRSLAEGMLRSIRPRMGHLHLQPE